MEISGKIICKKSDNKAFKLGDNWYNVNDNVIPDLTKMNKGDDVIVTYEQKNTSRYVSKLVSSASAQSNNTNTTGFVCEVCGKALKDDKFKKCFMCNKSGATKPATQEQGNQSTPTSAVKYGSAEDIAGKEKGCALGAAATVASGCAFSDPETAKQFVLELADAFVDWMRAKQ
jgi:hypothetical protein